MFDVKSNTDNDNNLCQETWRIVYSQVNRTTVQGSLENLELAVRKGEEIKAKWTDLYVQPLHQPSPQHRHHYDIIGRFL